MPTLNKLEYLDETKKQIKSALNTNFNSQITDDDTFRSYVSKIDNIYTNWPKVTGEGTELTLNNTKKGKMALTPKGNTHQDSYSGINLFNKYGDFTYGNNRYKTTLNELGQLVSTANYSSGRSAGLLIENLSQNTNYAFSGILVSASGTGVSANAVIEMMSITSSVIYREYISPSVTKPYNFSFTFNTGDNTSLWVSLSGVNSTTEGTTETVFDNLQLEKGSATEYEPYVGGIPSPNPDYPQPIRVVTGDNTITIGDGTNSENYSLNLGSIELCKIGNYQDYFYKDNGNWYLRKAVRHLSLAIADMNRVEDYPGWSDVPYLNSDYPSQNVPTFPANNLITNIGGNKNYFGLNTNGTKGILIMNKGAWNLTQTQWKTNYPNLMLEFYYSLATPTETEITDDNLIEQLEGLLNTKSYDTQTNISSTYTSGNAQMIISVAALKKGGN